MSDREIRSDAVLKRLPEQALEDLWRMRNPEEGGEPMTLEAICVEIPKLYGVSCSMGALSNFYKWLRFKRRMESGKALAEQVAREMQTSGMTVEQAHESAQYVFAQRTLDTDDPKLFIQLMKLKLQEDKIKNDSRRIEILERKAALADKAKNVSDDDALTDEEKAQRIKQIFRMG